MISMATLNLVFLTYMENEEQWWQSWAYLECKRLAYVESLKVYTEVNGLPVVVGSKLA